MQFTDGEDLYYTVLHAPIGICILNADTLVAEIVNDKFLEVAGKPYEAIFGQYYWDAFAEARVYYEEALAGVVKTGEPYYADEVEMMLIRHGRKETVFVTFVYAPVKDKNGKASKVAVWVLENTQQVNERQEITASEKRLRALVTATSDVTYGLSADWEVMYELDGRGFLKDTSEPITGWRNQNVYPDDMEMVNAAINEAIREKKIFQLEHRVLRADGSPGWTFSRAVPILNDRGEIVEWFGVASDITERKKDEEELQVVNEEMAASNEELVTANDELVQIQQLLQQETEERQVAIDRLSVSEQRSYAMVAAAPFPIAVYTGREMRITMANQAIINIWGKGNDVIGKTYHEILPELANQEIFQQLDDVFTTGKAFHARNQQVDIVMDGELRAFYFNYSFTPLFETDGQVYGVMNTGAEVTDLVLAKKQVEQSEENLSAVIAQAPVAMCILSGPEHIITVANDMIVELWGKPRADVMNKPVFDALPDVRDQGLEAIMKDVYETGESFFANELPVSLLRYGQTEKVYVNFVYQAYRTPTGQIKGIIAIAIDVTEQVLARKTIEQSATELREVQKKLEAELEISKQVQRQKDDFIGMVSHELKTPLTSLSAIVQVANAKLKTSDDQFLAGAMEKANTQVKRMSNMINGFLNVSRLESGKILIEKQHFDIEKLVHEIAEEMKVTVTGHPLDLNLCTNVQVYADRDKINSVISNLISNAVKYSPKDTVIKITCEAHQNEVIVSVKDKGMGIKPADAEKIFDRYYRVESSHTRHISGFGIGLYLSAEIIERHDGRIWLESEPDVGSTFYFSLPLEKQ